MILEQTLARVFNHYQETENGITETETAYEVAMDIPGAERDSIRVESQGNLVQVSAKRGKLAFSRSIQLAKGIDIKTVTAKYVDGVLTLTVPKKFSEKVLIPVQ